MPRGYRGKSPNRLKPHIGVSEETSQRLSDAIIKAQEYIPHLKEGITEQKLNQIEALLLEAGIEIDPATKAFLKTILRTNGRISKLTMSD